MRKFFGVFLLATALILPSVWAKRSGSFGVGVIAGDPFGPNIKYWLSEGTALDFGLGFDDDFAVYGDFHFAFYDGRPKNSPGTLVGYSGVGFLHEDVDNDDDIFGFRVPFGMEIFFDQRDFSLWGELAPVFEVDPETDVSFNAGLGFRYYFR